MSCWPALPESGHDTFAHCGQGTGEHYSKGVIVGDLKYRKKIE